MNMKTQFDLTPFYGQTIGYDRLMNNFIDRTNNNANYPPYNIINIDDNNYLIEIAVAGFSIDEITITSQDGQLLVSGEHNDTDDSIKYLHQGIGRRKFKRVFDLADYVEVLSANSSNGILTIELERQVPDSLKPKIIEITSIGPDSLDVNK